ncbi:uncharacterized protein KD926_007285 [Aspergillus affinis]|uniref:uncharacterized protein n=1 Tax=Aspergillus affinis TaxID=1070780 RepID=UPI0022FEC1B1|nr:uncharacterized protein KD926_007285 [Aspergillus affinis]KAI9041174.1 hypothetical protein KD926_007285 [Aspergillus affinis]
MPDKRKPPASLSGSSPHAKRPRTSYADYDEDEMPPAVTPYERPRNNPVYGQKSAFPGLDTAGYDELFYGPAEDGLEYLRMVRSEANSLPFLFNAPKPTEPADEPTITNDGTEEEPKESEEIVEKTETIVEGVYADGIYAASASITTGAPGHLDIAQTTYSDAQASYYNLLRHRFLLLRSILKCSPPSTAIAALDESHPISLPRHSKNACREWRRLLLAVDPQTVQLACMDMDSVLRVLGIMARLMSENVRSGDAERIRRIGAWAWGLLSRCRDVGQLGTEEVGEIRELGKRAVKILRKIKEEDEKNNRSVAESGGDAFDEEFDEDNRADDQEQAQGSEDQPKAASDPASAEAPDNDMPDAEEEPSTDELEQAKARLQAKIQDEPQANAPETSEPVPSAEDPTVEASMQTRAMLDMIITVIGEYYGQRDLLEARELWMGPTEEELAE